MPSKTKIDCNNKRRYWNCPCGGLVVRDEHYDLACGNCNRVQIDENEIDPASPDLRPCRAMPAAKAGATT